jgi:hypothetical protein
MRILAGLISLARFCFGVIFISRPKIMDEAWIGRQARLPGAQVLARGVGARDLALGLGGVQAAVRNDGSTRQWLGAAAICDAVDFGATWVAGRRIPRSSRTTVLGLAAGGTVLSLLAAIGASRNGHEEPLATTHDFTEAGAVPTEPVGTA